MRFQGLANILGRLFQKRKVSETIEDSAIQLARFSHERSPVRREPMELAIEFIQSQHGAVALTLPDGLTDLPDSLWELTAVQHLSVPHSKLREIPEKIANLKALKSLYVQSTGELLLPRTLGRLSQLEVLSLPGSRFREFPEYIQDLTNLTRLSLANNLIAKVPDWVGRFRRLKHLNLGYNRIETLPGEIGDLTALEDLNLEQNRLTELPGTLLKIPKLLRLVLDQNHALGLPKEILAATPAETLRYHLRTRKGSRPLNEAKLILVGRGGVGKTCLIKRLIHNTFDALELETPGIEIQPWMVRIGSGEDVRLHVWDFGGQEILHSTHQFFLTERAIYLLVLSGREGNPTQDAEYWLQLIRSFGGKSRVIIALNKSVQHPIKNLNPNLLREKYPFIIDFVCTDCKDPSVGIEELKCRIIEATEAIEHRRTLFPADWFAIKEQLSGMQDNFLSWDRFQGICHAEGEYDIVGQKELAGFLHILGIALNYRDDPRLQDTHVLNPRWVTEGIYAILRAGKALDSNGVISKMDLPRLLPLTRYPESCYEFLLHLMMKFELCFALRGNRDLFLVPELLPDNQPNVQRLLSTPGLRFRYQYEIIPEGIIPRFIVQMHELGTRGHRRQWRSGVILRHKECAAVVRADLRERRIDVHVIGPERARRDLLAVIRSKFDEQHADLKGLNVDERAPVPGHENVTVNYEHLLSLEADGELFWRPEGLKFKVSVAELLNGIEVTEDRSARKNGELGRSAPRGSARHAEIWSRIGPIGRPKCKVLMFAANPDRNAPLALDVEAREIEEKLRASEFRESVELITKWAVRPDDLLQALNQHKPQIVHFSGHGSNNSEIILTDSHGNPRPVQKKALKALFACVQEHVRVVVFNACFSYEQASALTGEIDCAIGMNAAIGDTAAIVFAASFYRAIGFGKSVQQAYRQGIAAISLHGIGGANIPILVSRSGCNADDIVPVPEASRRRASGPAIGDRERSRNAKKNVASS